MAHVPHTIVTEISLQQQHHLLHNQHVHHALNQHGRDSVGESRGVPGDRSTGNSMIGSPSSDQHNNGDWIRSRQGKKGEFRYF